MRSSRPRLQASARPRRRQAHPGVARSSAARRVGASRQKRLVVDVPWGQAYVGLSRVLSRAVAGCALEPRGVGQVLGTSNGLLVRDQMRAADNWNPEVLDRNSTPSSLKADNMSLKSGLSIRGSREGPGVERELPHHGQPLGRGGGRPIAIGRVVREWEDTDGSGSLRHPCSSAWDAASDVGAKAS